MPAICVGIVLVMMVLSLKLKSSVIIGKPKLQMFFKIMQVLLRV